MNPNCQRPLVYQRQLVRILFAFTSLAILLNSNCSIAAGQDLTAEEVRKSIDGGIRYLLSNQEPNGSWPDLTPRYRGGTTGLATLALLNSGIKPSNPRVAKAIRYLNSLSLDKMETYVVSLRIMVLAMADPKGKVHKLKIKKDVKWLLDSQITAPNGNPNIGGWGYAGNGMNFKSADGSNSQFALLALHEATQVGIKIDEIHWRRTLDYWRRLNGRRGGFGYTVKGNPLGTMTCAGISSMIIAQENLIDVDELLQNGDVSCCRPNDNDEIVERALQWLAKVFTVRYAPKSGSGAGRGMHKFYYLYGLERACRLAGRRFVGPHDWYRAGANELLKLQNRSNGSWAGKGMDERDKNIATSFALLFLSKGKRPVAIGKYKIGQDNDWNRHPKGVHFLTRKLEENWGTKLNWQTIDGNNAKLKDLLEAPVLFISGRDRLDLTQQQKQLLKKYIESGNFIYAEACERDGCGANSTFDRKFRALMAELFPDTNLEPLAADHPIWNSYHQVSPRADWVMYGLQACCRTSVVYCRRSFSCHWQMNRPRAAEMLPRKAADQIEYATQLGVNVVSYATGRQLRDKLDLPSADIESVKVLANRALVLPKLMHGGGSDDAPNAWRRMLERASSIGLRIDMTKKMVPAKLASLADHPFVFMHGRTSFRFSDEEREALRKYLDGGNRGFLFCDSICTNSAFAKSLRNEMKTIFPEYPLEKISADHPIWSDGDDGFGGYSIKSVTISKPDRDAEGGFEKRQVTPQLEGIEINGRLAVVFSPYDISCALENATVSQCEGYTREDATKICINILLYRLNRD